MTWLAPDATSVVAVAGAAAGGLGLLLAFAAHLRLDRLRRTYAALLGGATEKDLAGIVGTHVKAVAGLDAGVRALADDVAALRTDLGAALRHVAVVRYDAFGDMGGRLSFSAAMLDDAGDGVVLSAINGRTETRSYAKGVRAGASDYELSPEELKAIAHALEHAGLLPPGRAVRAEGATAAPGDAAPAEDEPEVVLVEARAPRAR